MGSWGYSEFHFSIKKDMGTTDFFICANKRTNLFHKFRSNGLTLTQF